jgi:hypothetical protein
MEVIGTCGHRVNGTSGGGPGNSVHIADTDLYGDNVLSHAVVCDECVKRYREEGLLLETEQARRAWLGKPEVESTCQGLKDLSGITEAMTQAGEDIASAMMDAHISYNMKGLGGCRTWKEWLEAHAEIPNLDLIEAYLKEEITSVDAIYLAMHRAKENR